MDGIKTVRGVLKKLMTKCRFDTLDQSGKGIFQSMNRDVVARPLLASHRHRGRMAATGEIQGCKEDSFDRRIAPVEGEEEWK
jgi:hypothetical protein